MNDSFPSNTALSLLFLAGLGCAGAPQDVATSRSPLAGQELSILVTGYSTSFAWPEMLQEMLDEHSGGQRVYHVLNATVGGSPIERWNAEPGERHYDQVFGPMLRDFFGDQPKLRGAAPAPTLAICQQSLQFTRTQRGPIAEATDLEGIQIGTDALEKHARKLRELGIERVYIGMHIYKRPIEPEVGNERIALRALLEREHPYIFPGPDIWQVTKDTYPDSFDTDGVHPNEYGMKLMAEHWYRTLAGPDAKQEIIRRMHERKYDVMPMMRAYLDWRRGTT